MKETIVGVVIEVTADTAKVKINRHSDCHNCGLCPGEDALVLEASRTADAKPGQRVLLELKNGNMLMAAFTVYILPILAIAGGIFLGYLAASHFKTSANLVMTLGGFIFGLAAVLVIKKLDLSLQSAKDMPKIIKIMN